MSKNVTADGLDNFAKHGGCARICTDLVDDDNCNLEIFGKFGELKEVSIQCLPPLPPSHSVMRGAR